MGTLNDRFADLTLSVFELLERAVCGHAYGDVEVLTSMLDRLEQAYRQKRITASDMMAWAAELRAQRERLGVAA